MPALPDDDDWLNERRRALGERIRAERLHQNLTQERLHLAAGISRDTLQAIEAGRGNPTITKLLRIARVLDVPLARLLEE
ncbi:helix-turn-helix transcriptional regulator [Streptomyces sp. PSKA54]|uniref:Helix-turn-helix transcriptional regulator n=1 Tax=Streptomyces himalayensis subsp. aureolus TaxID=2758039 RepID=A0A7W2HJ99_9ACTN|nr:helix-turn-helix transcriptional regulator [Streptomyces himalayensis]MBA4865892.1 helix-turn-helix transcriptional regulator [Streptomyces himalayensis subsp. aureolus]